MDLWQWQWRPHFMLKMKWQWRWRRRSLKIKWRRNDHLAVSVNDAAPCSLSNPSFIFSMSLSFSISSVFFPLYLSFPHSLSLTFSSYTFSLETMSHPFGNIFLELTWNCCNKNTCHNSLSFKWRNNEMDSFCKNAQLLSQNNTFWVLAGSNL